MTQRSLAGGGHNQPSSVHVDTVSSHITLFKVGFFFFSIVQKGKKK